MLKVLICLASVCRAVKTVLITKPEKHSHCSQPLNQRALPWCELQCFSAPDTVLQFTSMYIIICMMLLSLIQVNESALSCFPDLRRQMFRRGLISNVIWNVISNCLSQMISRFDLRLSLSFWQNWKLLSSVFAFLYAGTPPRTRPLISALKVRVTPAWDYKWPRSSTELVCWNANFSFLSNSANLCEAQAIIFQEGNSPRLVIISSQNAVLTPGGLPRAWTPPCTLPVVIVMDSYHL